MFQEVASGNVTRNMFDSNDVFVFDSGFEVFVWIGRGASEQEKKACFPQAQLYLQNSGKPSYLPVIRLQEGSQHPTFEALLK